jgi:flagellar M-ring protein FliF
VASSVPSLNPDDVTVSDQRGIVLSAPGEDNLGAALGDVQLRQKTAFENTLATQLEELAAKVVGPGKVDVKVSATLDFDQKASTSVTYVAPAQDAGATPLKEKEAASNETFSGTNSSGGTVGVLGPTGGPTNTNNGSNGQQSYQKTDNTTDYAIDQTTQEIREAPGKIEKLNVAVVLDKDSISQEDLKTIEDTLATAAGIDTARGDQITVDALTFDNTAAETAKAELAAAKSEQAKSASNDLIRTIAAVVIVLLILFFSWRSLRKAAKRARLNATTPLDLRELENLRIKLDSLSAGDGHLAALGPGELDDSAQLMPAEVSADERMRRQLEDEVGELIDKQPDEVARLLRSWLAERRVAKR